MYVLLFFDNTMDVRISPPFWAPDSSHVVPFCYNMGLNLTFQAIIKHTRFLTRQAKVTPKNMTNKYHEQSINK